MIFHVQQHYCFSILFVDDTSVFLEGTEISKLIKTLNNELENVTKWLNANRLTVNMKKKSLHDISAC